MNGGRGIPSITLMGVRYQTLVAGRFQVGSYRLSFTILFKYNFCLTKGSMEGVWEHSGSTMGALWMENGAILGFIY